MVGGGTSQCTDEAVFAGFYLRIWKVKEVNPVFRKVLKILIGVKCETVPVDPRPLLDVVAQLAADDIPEVLIVDMRRFDHLGRFSGGCIHSHLLF